MNQQPKKTVQSLRSKSPRLVLTNVEKNPNIQPNTPEINKKRIKIDEPFYPIRPTKSTLILRDANNKKINNNNIYKRETSPQKSYRDLNKK